MQARNGCIYWKKELKYAKNIKKKRKRKSVLCWNKEGQVSKDGLCDAGGLPRHIWLTIELMTKHGMRMRTIYIYIDIYLYFLLLLGW